MFSENLADLIVKVRPAYSPLSPELQGVQCFELEPAATFFFLSEDRFSINCYLRAALMNNNERSWQSQHTIGGTKEFYRLSQSVAEEVREHLSECIGRAVDLFALHKENGAAIFQDAVVDFGNRTEVLPVVASLLPDRLVFFHSQGMTEWDRKLWRSAVLK